MKLLFDDSIYPDLKDLWPKEILLPLGTTEEQALRLLARLACSGQKGTGLYYLVTEDKVHGFAA